MQKQDLLFKLQTRFPQATISVTTNDEVHFSAIIINDQFADLTQLARQRAVYSLVQEQLQDGSLHALELKTYTNAEWQDLQSCAN